MGYVDIVAMSMLIDAKERPEVFQWLTGTSPRGRESGSLLRTSPLLLPTRRIVERTRSWRDLGGKPFTETSTCQSLECSPRGSEDSSSPGETGRAGATSRERRKTQQWSSILRRPSKQAAHTSCRE